MFSPELQYPMTGDDLRELEIAVSDLSFGFEWSLKLGSWQAQVYSTSSGPLETLRYLYKQLSESEKAIGFNCRMYLVKAESFSGSGNLAESLLSKRDVPPDGYLTQKLSLDERSAYHSVSLLKSEMAVLLCVRDSNGERIYIFVINDKPAYDFQVHLSFLVNYALFNSGRLYLHAGAVRYADRVSLFVGERGAGKSTVCLRLGQAGATVLSDDHVMIRQDRDRFWVSGCGELARVTEKTEGFLFNQPLDAKPNDYAGLLKKEFRIDEYFNSEPAKDYPLDEIYFLTRGNKLTVNQISAQEATLELMTRTKSALRFNSPLEAHRYLDYFAQLAKRVPACWLTLTSDLSDLNSLIQILSERALR